MYPICLFMVFLLYLYCKHNDHVKTSVTCRMVLQSETAFNSICQILLLRQRAIYRVLQLVPDRLCFPNIFPFPITVPQVLQLGFNLLGLNHDLSIFLWASNILEQENLENKLGCQWSLALPVIILQTCLCLSYLAGFKSTMEKYTGQECESP